MPGRLVGGEHAFLRVLLSAWIERSEEPVRAARFTAIAVDTRIQRILAFEGMNLPSGLFSPRFS